MTATFIMYFRSQSQAQAAAALILAARPEDTLYIHFLPTAFWPFTLGFSPTVEDHGLMLIIHGPAAKAVQLLPAMAA